jgi:hypothetical protein
MMWLEALCEQRIAMTPMGIKPAAFQLVAQHLNQLCHHSTISLKG